MQAKKRQDMETSRKEGAARQKDKEMEKRDHEKEKPTASEAPGASSPTVPSDKEADKLAPCVPPKNAAEHLQDEVCEERPPDPGEKPKEENAQAPAAPVARRLSYSTPAPDPDPETIEMNSETASAAASSSSSSSQDSGETETVSGSGGGGGSDPFLMPLSFDIPVDVIRTHSEQAGRAAYAPEGAGTSADGGTAAANTAEKDKVSTSTDQGDGGGPALEDAGGGEVLPEVSDSSEAEGEASGDFSPKGTEEKDKEDKKTAGTTGVMKSLFGEDEDDGEDTEGDGEREEEAGETEKEGEGIASILKGPKSRISTLSAAHNDLVYTVFPFDECPFR